MGYNTQPIFEAPVLGISNSDTVCFKGVYEPFFEKANGAITIGYVKKSLADRLTDFLSNQLVLLSDEQLKVVESFISVLDSLSANMIKEVEISLSVELEVCFSRKTDRGYSLFAIDTDGDSMYSFIGTAKEDDALNFYTIEELDPEFVSLKFFSK
jgi:hypothetical protein